MSRRTRVPGPIVQDQTLGNTEKRQENGLNRWKSLDVNDGSWTLYDPHSTIVSATTTADGIRLVTDKDQNSTSRRMSTGNQAAGRYHKKLVGPDGNVLKFSDFFSIEFLIKCHTVHANTDGAFSAGDRSGVTVGLAGPNVGSATAFDFINQTLFIKGSGANPKMQSQLGGKQGMTSAEDAGCRGVHTTISPAIDDDDAGDTNPSFRHIAGVMIDSNSDAVHLSNAGTRSSINSTEFTSTDDVHIFMANNWGTAVSNIADADATWSIWYRINFNREGLNPVYTPGGGLSG